MGERACEAAAEGDVAIGEVGAGTGATVGKLFGVARASRGGVGVAAMELEGAGTVAALAAVNAFGDVVDPGTGEVLAGPSGAEGGLARTTAALAGAPLRDPPAAAANTTLVCVATSVAFDQASLKRVAIEAHDGIARAVRPAHTVVDGDVTFALAPDAHGPAPPIELRLRVGAAAAECAARAIVAAVRSVRP
jgi:L-aminopeptidase/D-esterase-like protein